MVARLTEVLDELGWVLDFRQFGNAALAIQFELPARDLSRLRGALATVPISLSDASLDALSAFEDALEAELPDEVAGSLHVTFFHSEPDLRIPVPAVPG